MASFVTFPQFIANEVLARPYAKSVLVNLVAEDWSLTRASKREAVTVITPEAAEIESGSDALASSDSVSESVAVTLDLWIRTKAKKIGDKVDSMSQI
jgi:hypothetical protein